MEKQNEKGHLCCIIQGKGNVTSEDIMEFYRRNRYYPGLTGAVVLGEDHILLVLEGQSSVVVEKFMEMTSSFKAFIEILSTGSLFNNKRTFNSWDFGLNIANKNGVGGKLVKEMNQEEVSTLTKILNDELEPNFLTRSVKSFLLKGQKTDRKNLLEEN